MKASSHRSIIAIHHDPELANQLPSASTKYLGSCLTAARTGHILVFSLLIVRSHSIVFFNPSLRLVFDARQVA